MWSAAACCRLLRPWAPAAAVAPVRLQVSGQGVRRGGTGFQPVGHGQDAHATSQADSQHNRVSESIPARVRVPPPRPVVRGVSRFPKSTRPQAGIQKSKEGGSNQPGNRPCLGSAKNMVGCVQRTDSRATATGMEPAAFPPSRSIPLGLNISHNQAVSLYSSEYPTCVCHREALTRASPHVIASPGPQQTGRFVGSGSPDCPPLRGDQGGCSSQGAPTSLAGSQSDRGNLANARGLVDETAVSPFRHVALAATR